MKRFLVAALLLPLFTFAQIQYEPGYFITNDGSRTESLILNTDWKNNPVNFKYKMAQEGAAADRSIDQVSEFGIDGVSRYVRSEIDFDTSPEDPAKLDFNGTPNFQKRTVFLKVLVQGSATLYKYESPEGTRFYYSMDSGTTISPLIYKRYRKTVDDLDQSKVSIATYERYRKSGMYILENTAFRQSLLNDLQCGPMNRNEFGRLDYKEDDLRRVVNKYNACTDPAYTPAFQQSGSGYLFNLSLRPGLNFSTAYLQTSQIDYESAMGLRIGLEFEMVFPFNKNKWSILLEPTYRNYQADGSSAGAITPGLTSPAIDYPSIEFAIGARHYMYVSESTAVYLSVYLLNDMELDASLNSTGFTTRSFEIDPVSNFAFGAGIKYNKKISMEFRYDTKRELLKGPSRPYTEFNNISVILGYTLF